MAVVETDNYFRVRFNDVSREDLAKLKKLARHEWNLPELMRGLKHEVDTMVDDSELDDYFFIVLPKTYAKYVTYLKLISESSTCPWDGALTGLFDDDSVRNVNIILPKVTGNRIIVKNPGENWKIIKGGVDLGDFRQLQELVGGHFEYVNGVLGDNGHDWFEGFSVYVDEDGRRKQLAPNFTVSTHTGPFTILGPVVITKDMPMPESDGDESIANTTMSLMEAKAIIKSPRWLLKVDEQAGERRIKQLEAAGMHVIRIG